MRLRFRLLGATLVGVSVMLLACSSPAAIESGQGTPLAPDPVTTASTSRPNLPVVVSTSPAGAVGSNDPLSDVKLWTDPSNPAATQAATWRSQSQLANAGLISKIATQPVATWFADESARTMARLSSVVSAARRADQVPLIVLYDLPGRDCDGYSQGGAANAAAYRQWIDAVASRIGSTRAVVVLEPDAVPQTILGCGGSDRYALLAYAVTVLKRLHATSVYVDAGHPGWVDATASLAAALRASGVATADGFSVNVSNFMTTADDLAFGDSLSAQLGGAHFVIDTSRNGAGPLPAGDGYTGPQWCNPPGRALGLRPTTVTGDPHADAYLWIKQPGASDGSCGLGDPPPGEWWADYALGLAQRS